MNNIKRLIIEEMEKEIPSFRKVSETEYRMRCVLCGDSIKNPNDAHCYIKASFDPNEPLLFNCFKCNSKGKINKKFLDKLGINIDDFSELDKQLFNRISSPKKPSIDIICDNPNIYSDQVKYIEYRLGSGFTIEDYKKFKIVWNINNIFPYIVEARIKNSLPSNNNSISFLSEDKLVLLTRFFSDEEPRWKKMKIIPSSNRSLYTIKNTLDLFTKDNIYINIAEGVFDVLSIYKNFNTGDNSIYVATLGSDYMAGLDYIIDLGLVGNNIILKIFIDSDIDEKYIKFKLKNLKWLFKTISIFKNIKAEDVGKRIEDIVLMEHRI